jgi:hypothetical protein
MQITQFKGLNLQQNSFQDSAQGFLEIAENIIFSQDDIIQKRNGYATFLSSPPPSPVDIIDYKNKLILTSRTTISRIDQTIAGDFQSITALLGQTFTISLPRSAQAGGNLFIPSNNFIIKLEDTTSSLLKAGVNKAPDLLYLPLGSGSSYAVNTGIHAPDTQIGYRVLFGRKDVNQNLILGAPSEFTQTANLLMTATSISIATSNVTVTYAAHGLVTNDFVTIKNANGTIPVPDGEYVVTGYTTNTFTISTAAVLTATANSTALKFGKRIQPQLEFTIPADVNSPAFLYRVYRSNASINNDVEPDESTLQLIYEANVTSAQLATGYINYTDTVDDLFKSTYLYTNPNTGEGETEANFPPPVGLDIALFKNHLFIANTTNNYTLDVSLIRSSASTFTNGDYVDILQTNNNNLSTTALWQSGTTVRYTTSSTVDFIVGMYVDITGFVNAANNGRFIITSKASSYIQVTNPGRTSSTGDETTAQAALIPVRRYTAASSNSYNTAAGGEFALSTSSPSVSVNIDTTARALCRVVNRDNYSNIYASYTSTSQSVVGQMFFYSRLIDDTFVLQASSATVGANFSPNIPNALDDYSVTGTNTQLPNGLYISKESEFEAFPLLSYLLVGSKTAQIQRIIPLKNSLIIIKEDGVFRLSGNNRSDFLVTPIDLTIFCNAPESAVDTDNVIFVCTTSGIARITESAVSIVSRPIEPVLHAVFTNANFYDQTFAAVVPSDRHYFLTTLQPNNAGATTYVYNLLADKWSTSTILYRRGVIKFADNTHYAISSEENLIKARKTSTRLDFCDESAQVIAISEVAADKLSCRIISPLPIGDGDVIAWQSSINRIDRIVDGIYYFVRQINFTDTDLPFHYRAITSTWAMAPIGLNEEILKQFSELSLNCRNTAITHLDIGFISDNAETVFKKWSATTANLAWGISPWGYFPWGAGETINLNFTTYSAQPVRIFIPVDTQITTWLKPKFRHGEAAELINLQSMNLKVRNISERISK